LIAAAVIYLLSLNWQSNCLTPVFKDNYNCKIAGFCHPIPSDPLIS
jgi:hypothetical protein